MNPCECLFFFFCICYYKLAPKMISWEVAKETVCVLSCVQPFRPLSSGFCLWYFSGRILEWAAVSSSRGSFWSGDRTSVLCVFCTADEFLSHPCYATGAVAQMVKRLPAVRESRVWSLGWEDLLEKEMATHSSMLAWRIPWTEEPGRL